MRKRIHVYKDGSQSLIKGDMDIRSATEEVVKAYEIHVSDEDFEAMMEKPDKVKVDKIKHKKTIHVKELGQK